MYLCTQIPIILLAVSTTSKWYHTFLFCIHGFTTPHPHHHAQPLRILHTTNAGNIEMSPTLHYYYQMIRSSCPDSNTLTIHWVGDLYAHQSLATVSKQPIRALVSRTLASRNEIHFVLVAPTGNLLSPSDSVTKIKTTTIKEMVV